jgi:hypothetical protein
MRRLVIADDLLGTGKQLIAGQGRIRTADDVFRIGLVQQVAIGPIKRSR